MAFRKRAIKKESMKIKLSRNKQIAVPMLFLFAGMTSCERDMMFSVRNCYGGSVEVTIQFGKEQSKLTPEVIDSLDGNQINFKLDYPEIKEIFRTSQELEEGLPFRKMLIIRNGDTTILNYGDQIIPRMDTDPFGLATYTICI